MDLPPPPPPTMTTTHLHLTSPPTIQLQPAPPPRNIQNPPQQSHPQTQQHNTRPSSPPPPIRQNSTQHQNPEYASRQPNEKSQDEWLRECGHSNLHDFLEYYGFDQKDPGDAAAGRGFLQQIRRQEQEVWEERQARRGGGAPGVVSKGGVVLSGIGNGNGAMHVAKVNGFTSLNGNHGGGNQNRVYEAAYGGGRGYELENVTRERAMSHGSGGGPMGVGVGVGVMNRGMQLLQQQQRQIPRSSADPRFHMPVATMGGRGVSEAMLNAYGIKSWDLEGPGKVHAEYTRYER